MEKWSVINHYRNILKNEDGYILKNGALRVALVYPNNYEIASQNLGFQQVYAFLNSLDKVVCERFVLDFYEDNLSIETQRFFNEFRIIFLSVNYEQDVLNFVRFLQSQKISPFVSDRHDCAPLIIAGGALTFINPCLLYRVADVQLCGDLEPMQSDIKVMLENYTGKTGALNFLKTLKYSVYSDMERKSEVIRSNSNIPIISQIKTSKGEFADEILAELSCGCKYRCRFCSASHIYRPFRLMDYSHLIKYIGEKSSSKNYGIISATFCDLPEIGKLLDDLYDNGCKVSVSSLRADSLDTELITKLKKCGVRSITIAEETVERKLKLLIGKNISSDNILNAVKSIAEVGIENLKLYYMIGLPGESFEDIKLIVKRISEIREIFIKTQIKYFNRLGRIKVSINIFIPKPFTPMQYFGIENKKMLQKKIDILNRGLKVIPNLSFSIMSYSSAYLQATLSRGDKNIAEFYKEYLKDFNIKNALKRYTSNAELTYEPEYMFDWEKFLSPNFDVSLLKKIHLKMLNILKMTGEGSIADM